MHMTNLLNLQCTSWFGNAMQYPPASQVKEDGRLANAHSSPDGDWL